jgi:putative transposase
VRAAALEGSPSLFTRQGSHVTSPQYRELLLAAGVRISMDGRGRALDYINALTAVAFC